MIDENFITNLRNLTSSVKKIDMVTDGGLSFSHSNFKNDNKKSS